MAYETEWFLLQLCDKKLLLNILLLQLVIYLFASVLISAEIVVSVMGSIPATDDSDVDECGPETERPWRTKSEAITSIEIVLDYLSSCVDIGESTVDHCSNTVSELEEYLLTSGSRNLRQKKIDGFKWINKSYICAQYCILYPRGSDFYLLMAFFDVMQFQYNAWSLSVTCGAF